MKTNFSKTQLTPEALTNYLMANHLGKENGISRIELAKKLGIHERELRRLVKAVNESTEIMKLVSTSHACYMCDTKEECERATRNTYRVAISLFKKAKAMEKKVGLNGQIKIDLGEDYKDFVQTFSKGDN
jgi:DNA-binding transcriptional regulator LsrR (DeoR family)